MNQPIRGVGAVVFAPPESSLLEIGSLPAVLAAGRINYDMVIQCENVTEVDIRVPISGILRLGKKNRCRKTVGARLEIHVAELNIDRVTVEDQRHADAAKIHVKGHVVHAD